MKKRMVKNSIIGLMILVTLSIVSIFNYNGYVEAKSACVNNNGTITEDDLGLLGLNWSVSCDI